MLVRVLAAAAIMSGGLCLGAGAQPLPPQLTYVQPLSRPAVQAVQQRLREAGDYNGRLDGVWGPDSVVALQRFQQTHGLQVTGELNQATVATLGLNVDALLGTTQQAAMPSQAEPMMSPRAVRAVQDRLRQFGFYRGPDDGVWGPETQSAIARFQESRGLQPTSQINPATLAALGFQSDLFAAR